MRLRGQDFLTIARLLTTNCLAAVLYSTVFRSCWNGAESTRVFDVSSCSQDIDSTPFPLSSITQAQRCSRGCFR